MGFHNKAQGCAAPRSRGATLGSLPAKKPTLKGLPGPISRLPRDCLRLAWLGGISANGDAAPGGAEPRPHSTENSGEPFSSGTRQRLKTIKSEGRALDRPSRGYCCP